MRAPVRRQLALGPPRNDDQAKVRLSGMQSQPLVETSPPLVHHRHHNHHHTHHHNRHHRLVHATSLSSLNRFRSAVRNTLHHLHRHRTLVLQQHHSDPQGPALSADRAVSMSGHQQMGRLRKFTGAALLSRFRSVSKATSDDDEVQAARSDATGCVQTAPTLACAASQPDPVAAATTATSSGVKDGHTNRLHGTSDVASDQANDDDANNSSSGTALLAGGRPTTLINGGSSSSDAAAQQKRNNGAPPEHLSTCGRGTSPEKRQQQTPPAVGVACATGISGVVNAIEVDTSGQDVNEATAVSPGSPARSPKSSSAPNDDDLDTDGVRVYKKVSTNGKLVLYLVNRDLVITKGSVSPLHAVVTVDADELRNKKIFAQILLTFRYGRDDEEVMGLKLSNESVLCVEQVYPLMAGAPPQQPLTKCQEVLMKRLGPQAHLINLKLNHAVPASVRLLPAKEYRGAAIGINYDLRVYTAETIEEKPQRRSQVRMAIRLVQYAPPDIQQTEAPQLRMEKHFLLREGTLQVDAGLDRQWYMQGSPIVVRLRVHNRSSRIVKKLQIRAIQHVDVTMFSNGKFKNTIAISEEMAGLPLTSGSTLEQEYTLALMENGGGRHWVALEDRYGRLTATLASTTLKNAPNERHFFAIYISYYVKVRLIVSGVGGDVSVKIPFTLMRDGPETNPTVDALDDLFAQSGKSPEPHSSPGVHAITDHTVVDSAKCPASEVGELGDDTSTSPTPPPPLPAVASTSPPVGPPSPPPSPQHQSLTAVERIELHPEPKLFISGEASNDDQLPTSFNSTIELTPVE